MIGLMLHGTLGRLGEAAGVERFEFEHLVVRPTLPQGLSVAKCGKTEVYVRLDLVCPKRRGAHTQRHSNTRESPIMFYALSWFVVVALLSLWSLTAWALHAAAVWMVSNAGALSGAASGAHIMDLPDWLTPWVPPDVAQWASQTMQGLAPFVDSLLQVAPALAGGLTVVTWVIWGIGSVLLMLLGVGLHLRIALLRRRGDGGSGPNAGASLVAGLLR